MAPQARAALLRNEPYAVPRPSGPRCRPEVGVPSRPRDSSRLAMGVSRPRGRGADRRSAFQAVPAILLPRRCAVPRPAGPLCRPEVGVPSRPRDSPSSAMCGSAARRAAVPTGGRRSKPSPRFFLLGDVRFRGPPGRGADRRSAFQAVPAILLPQRCAVSWFRGLRGVIPFTPTSRPCSRRALRRGSRCGSPSAGRRTRRAAGQVRPAASSGRLYGGSWAFPPGSSPTSR